MMARLLVTVGLLLMMNCFMSRAGKSRFQLFTAHKTHVPGRDINKTDCRLCKTNALGARAASRLSYTSAGLGCLAEISAYFRPSRKFCGGAGGLTKIWRLSQIAAAYFRFMFNVNGLVMSGLRNPPK